MPPEAFPSPAFVTTLNQFRPSLLPKSHFNFPACHKFCRKRRMEVNITKRRLLHLLLLIIACMSIFRLVRLAITTYSFTPNPVFPLPMTCDSKSSACEQRTPIKQMISPTSATAITTKEYRFLAELIGQRAPCNLLVFGMEPQYMLLSEINAAGTTVFLVDNPEKVKNVRSRSNNTRIYRVKHEKPARDAYKLLRHARKKRACAPNPGPIEASACRLALTELPKEVYGNKWDVVLVDGPSSDAPDAPGRMAAIYTASLIARAGNITNVVVHDVDRTIEKWFSWEFLCEENLVSSKGKFWNFRIMAGVLSKATRFCTRKTRNTLHVLDENEQLRTLKRIVKQANRQQATDENQRP
ncbi:hypothetical protein Ancab_035593 [Ancistrocladus abbreviatus]